MKSEGDRFQDDEAVSGCDPQLPILLRTLYEKGQQEDQEQAMHLKKNPIPAQPESPTKKKSSTRITYAMLELGIAQSLCIAIQSSVGDASSATSITAEVVTSLVQLLHRSVRIVLDYLAHLIYAAVLSISTLLTQLVVQHPHWLSVRLSLTNPNLLIKCY